MAQRPTADYPIDANTTSGTDLSLILNRFQTALESGNSGSSRPAYITAGGLWVKEGDPMELYLYDGTTDQLLYDTSNGINVTEGLWTLVDENNEAGQIQRPSDVLIDGNLTVTGDLVDGNGDPISIIDPATEDGVIATWNNTDGRWTPDSSLTVDTSGEATFGGKVGVGGLPPNGSFTIGNTTSGRRAIFDYLDNQDLRIWNNQNNNTGKISFVTGAGSGTEVLTIDSTGNATFSGSVQTGAFTLLDDGYFAITHKNTSNFTEVYTNGNMFLAGVLQGPGNTWSIDSTGDATFSGAVNTYGDFISTSTPSGGYFTASGNFAGESQAAGMVMVRPSQKVNNFITCTNAGHGGAPVFSVGPTGNTRAAGQQLIGTRDLIETLSTLRNATKDEETLEGLRDAIGDAVGGLIQKFEAIQAEAKEKLEEAYNQTGTQEITPDNPEVGTMDD